MALLMDMSFFTTYFSWKQTSFNVVNTVTYAIIAIIALYIIYKVFNRFKVKFDIKFFLSILPFILIGSGTRALVDNEYINESFWLVTPGIYLVVAALFLSVYLICFLLGKKLNFKEWKACGIIGIILLVSLFLIYRVKLNHVWILFVILGLATVISLSIGFVFNLLKQKNFTKKLSLMTIFGHMVDASATFVAVDFFNAWEKHPLTRFFNDFTGTAASFFILKLMVVIPAVYLITTEIEDKNFRNFLLIALATLGLAEGLRNTLSLIFLV